MNRYDYVCLGSAPAEEQCAQVGEPNFEERAQNECERYLKLIRDIMGKEPYGAELSVKWFGHELSPYGYPEVVCYWDNDFPDSEDYAFECEERAPVTWKGK